MVFAIEVPEGAAAVVQPSPADMVFLLLLGVALAAIGLVGWRAYDDAEKEFKTLSNAKVWAQWLGEAGLALAEEAGAVQVLTAEGPRVARPGDWIVLSVGGRFHVACSGQRT